MSAHILKWPTSILANTHLGEAQMDWKLRVKTVLYINSLRQPGASPQNPLLQNF